MRSVRSLLVRVLAGVLHVVARLSGRQAGLVLVYHELVDGGDPSAALVRPHETVAFEAQLRHLSSRYRLVPAEGIQEVATQRRRGQRFPVALTFDDDLVSHVQHAAPILRRAGAPATFFLCGASLDRPHVFWWQRLHLAVEAGLELPVAGRALHDVADRIESMHPDQRRDLDAWLAERLGPAPSTAGLRSGQVRELARAGFGIGFHTLRHDRLVGLDDDALRAALSDGRPELESAAGLALSAIAYPHGKADDATARAAERAGFRRGFTGRYEPVRAFSDPLLLGRIEPVHDSGSRFAIQLVRALLRDPQR